MIKFGRLTSEGEYEHIRTLPQSAILGCPHFIMDPDHYREDSTCRCNDPEHTEMKEWGYVWNGKVWE